MSWDRFAYVNNNPVNANDPSGHFKCSVSAPSVHREEAGELTQNCQQTIEDFLRILEEQGGDEGVRIAQSFRARDTLTICPANGLSPCSTFDDAMTIKIVDEIPEGGGYAAGDGRIGGTIYVLANVMRQWIAGTGQEDLIHAGILAHEYVHVEQGFLAGSVGSEAEAFAKQNQIYGAMGVTPRNSGNHWAVVNANRYADAYTMNVVELSHSALRTQEYPSYPLYKIWGPLSSFYEAYWDVLGSGRGFFLAN